MIVKHFHDDGVTPIEDMHPAVQSELDVLKDAVAQIAEVMAEMKEKLNEPKPKGFRVVRDKSGKVAGAEPVN